MCLKLSASSIAIADQTPTPSRFLGSFLQNWEESGLSHDIQEIANLTPILGSNNTINNNNNTINSNNKSSVNSSVNSKSSSIRDNPFAASFQNALKNNNNITNRLKTPKDMLTTDSPLNTPSIFPHNEGLMAIANAALNTPDQDYRYYSDLTQTNEKTNTTNTNINAIRVDNSLSSQSSNSSSIEATTGSVSLNEGSDTSCGKNGSQQKETNINVVKPQKFKAVSVICSAATNFINSSNSQTIPNIVISQQNNKIKSNTKLKTLPVAQTSRNAAIIAPKTKESFTIANTNSSYKVILKLPDGRCLQLPSVQPIAVNSSFVSTTAQSIAAITNSTKNTVNNNDITNNETIHLANKINIGALSSSSSSSSSSSQITQSSGTSFSALQSRVDATLASLPPRAKPGRKSKFAPEEDPKEKKARSLERNRAAAMRCRLKRKTWIDSLEEKADEYEKINEKLQVFPNLK
jgi:hypothetical protein